MEGVHETSQIKSKGRLYCEEHIISTHFWRGDGSYVVEMPMETYGFPQLGKSKKNANKRLNHLFKRFSLNQYLKNFTWRFY